MGISEERQSDGKSLRTLEITDVSSPLGQAVLQETRLRIMAVLASPESKRRGGYTLQELGQILDCSPQNAHHHLKILERAKMVRVARTEATQRIPRQFWVSDIEKIRLRPIEGSVLDLDMGHADEYLHRLSKDLKPWAEAHGGPDSYRVVFQLAAFVGSLDEGPAEELLEILKRARSP